MKRSGILRILSLIMIVYMTSSCEALNKYLQNQGNQGASAGKVPIKEGYNPKYNPNGQRYVDYVFQNATKRKETFATGVKRYDGSSQNLVMDIYTPVGDNEKNRPCVVFIFGGGWNWKIEVGVPEFMKAMAMKGYVAIATDYRVGFKNGSTLVKCIGSADDIKEAAYRGVQDNRAALRHIKANAEKLGVDPTKIIVGGESAGAFNTLNLVYLDESEVEAAIKSKLGGIDAIGNYKNIDPTPMAIYTFAGSTFDLSSINRSDVPTYLFQGDCDEFLHLKSGTIYKCDSKPGYPKISGSEAIYNKLQSQGGCVKLELVCKGGHTFSAWRLDTLLDKVTDFAVDVMTGKCKSGTSSFVPMTMKCPNKQNPHPLCK